MCCYARTFSFSDMVLFSFPFLSPPPFLRPPWVEAEPGLTPAEAPDEAEDEAMAIPEEARATP